VTLTSTAFDPTLILLPSSAVTLSGSTITAVNWNQAIINTDGGGVGNAWLLENVAQGSTWYAAVTAKVQSQGNYTLTWIDNAKPIVPTALTELDYTYYADGSVHTVTDSSNVSAIAVNTATTTYGYDVLSRITTISQSGSGASTKQVQFGYYNDNQVQTVTLSGTSQVAVGTYGYDADGRLASLAYTQNSQPLKTVGNVPISYSLEEDAAGNITELVSADGTSNYTLDAANELNSASLTSENYLYDANGNRTENHYATGAGNRLLYDGAFYYQYDADGNRTARYESTTGALDSTAWNITIYAWDYRNRLVQETNYSSYSTYQAGTSTQVVTYTYDYAGWMIRRGEGTSLTSQSYVYTVYDGQNAYLQVSDQNHLANGGASASISERYLYGQAVDQIFATDRGGGNVLWGLADYEGTIRDVLNSSGVAQNHIQFNSFGNPINAPAVGFLFGLDGMRYDQQTNEYLTETERLDPATNQRLSQDPLGFASGTTNFTAYDGNNAVQNVDPSGMSTITSDSPQDNYPFDPSIQSSNLAPLPPLPPMPPPSLPLEYGLRTYSAGTRSDCYPGMGLSNVHVYDPNQVLAPPVYLRSLQLGNTGEYVNYDQQGRAWYDGMRVKAIQPVGTGIGPFDKNYSDTPWSRPASKLLIGVAASLFPPSEPSFQLTLEDPYGGSDINRLVLSGGPTSGRMAAQALSVIGILQANGIVPPATAPAVETVPVVPSASEMSDEEAALATWEGEGGAVAPGEIGATSQGINYGSLDALGRPTGVTATITRDMIGTGTPANPSVTPPGWSGNGTFFNEARGHLLGAQLGGSGDVAENLVTLQQLRANSPVMRGFETSIRAAVENGEVVEYSATPIYNGDNLVPRGITISAHGSGGFSLDVTVLNPAGK